MRIRTLSHAVHLIIFFCAYSPCDGSVTNLISHNYNVRGMIIGQADQIGCQELI